MVLSSKLPLSAVLLSLLSARNDAFVAVPQSSDAGRSRMIAPIAPPLVVTMMRTAGSTTSGEEEDRPAVADYRVSSRRHLFTVLASSSSAAAAAAILLAAPSTARADVSDGNVLPQGAQQFANVVKLKSNLKDVYKRLTTAKDSDNPLDKKEWDNIGKFLRNTYATAENDMKAIAKGVSNPENKERAVKDADQIKKYAQAGDVSASKQDAAGLASILSKISALVTDFLDSLSDVPDEI